MKEGKMKKEQQNNHFEEEIAELAKTFEQHESVVLGDEYIIPQKPVEIPFPYGSGKPKPFGSDIDFNGWLPRRHRVPN